MPYLTLSLKAVDFDIDGEIQACMENCLGFPHLESKRFSYACTDRNSTKNAIDEFEYKTQKKRLNC